MNKDNKANMKEKLQGTVDQFEGDYSPRVMKQLKNVANEMINHNKTAKEALNITPKIMDISYEQAYKYFKSGQYKSALAIFQLLNMLELTYNYSFGAAACHHYLKEYENAIVNYSFCGQLDLTNPIPHYHMADCFIKLNNPASSFIEIIKVLTLTKDKPEYAIIREKTLGEFKSLKEIIREKYS